MLAIDLHMHLYGYFLNNWIFGGYLSLDIHCRLMVGCGDLMERSRLGWHLLAEGIIIIIVLLFIC